MSYKVGEKVTYYENRAVVTSVTDSGYDVAMATEHTNGRCRQMHTDVNSDMLESGWPDSED